MTTTDTATHALEGTVYLGRATDRTHLYATIRLEPTAGRTVHMTDHTIGLEPLRVSITGAVLAPRAPVHGGTVDPREVSDGWVYGWGQTTSAPTDAMIGTPALPLADLAIIAEAWEHWHLNDMRAGCVHQGPDSVVGEVGACPEGYRYGSAWLAEAAPWALLRDLERIIRTHAIGGAE